MKKQLSVIIGALAILATTNSYAETNWGTRSGSSANLSSAPSTRTRENVNYKKLENFLVRLLTMYFVNSLLFFSKMYYN